MGYKLITQIGLIIVSIVIILTFVKPTFGVISETQDQLLKYQTTAAQASELNNLLRDLVAKEQSYSPSEMRSLDTYLPNKIDHISTMRDIQNIFATAGIPIISLMADAEGTLSKNVALEGATKKTNVPNIVYRDFNMSFVAPYSKFKEILGLIESNAYPLEVVTLDFAADDAANPGVAIGAEGQMRYNLVVRAFALAGSR